MKKIILILLIFLISENIFSQNKDYSFAVSAGPWIPGNDLSNVYNIGVNLGFDFQNYYKPLSFLIESNLNIFPYKKGFYPNQRNFNESLEFTAGTRY